MNQNQRNSILATHEDDALDKYLDDEDRNTRCEWCLIDEIYIEYKSRHINVYICQSCYEDACEQAEMAVEREDE